MSVDVYVRELQRRSVAQICDSVGWDSIHGAALEVLADVLGRYLLKIGRVSHAVSEQSNRTACNLFDVGFVFHLMGISTVSLGNYLEECGQLGVPGTPPIRWQPGRPGKCSQCVSGNNGLQSDAALEHGLPGLPPYPPGYCRTSGEATSMPSTNGCLTRDADHAAADSSVGAAQRTEHNGLNSALTEETDGDLETRTMPDVAANCRDPDAEGSVQQSEVVTSSSPTPMPISMGCQRSGGTALPDLELSSKVFPLDSSLLATKLKKSSKSKSGKHKHKSKHADENDAVPRAKRKKSKAIEVDVDVHPPVNKPKKRHLEAVEIDLAPAAKRKKKMQPEAGENDVTSGDKRQRNSLKAVEGEVASIAKPEKREQGVKPRIKLCIRLPIPPDHAGVVKADSSSRKHHHKQCEDMDSLPDTSRKKKQKKKKKKQ